MAKRGVRVVIAARDRKKAAKLKEGIQRDINPNAEIIVLEIDLSSLASVKKFCTQFLALGLPLNILINNAGIFSQNLEISEEKIEMTFATNYLGHFLLTELLIEKMIETAEQTGIQGRIINLSSVIHSWVKRDCFTFNQMLNPNKYFNSFPYIYIYI
ncbi:short-chain dehydrogenase TIC 32 B, chloroplastic-like [Hibiscus syriacus]|uniref:short-chain dehydrogenase TIC 32 B, chloroplastic-like n=1 Tax=Hibiscus syriacus TaxID=106335 RepID=UPI001921A09A|nr:short-chain dehydrogenase TIC 32 B, chloroplastic-like [Hibiscus syriacus]